MRADAYIIDGPWIGQLAIVPRPRGGDWLESEVQGWKKSGIDSVLSLLTPDEVAEFDLAREAEWCRRHGIEHSAFSIPDRGVPESQKLALSLVRKIEHSLAQGKHVAIHCRQGIGRSALMAACLLMLGGETADQALTRISKARGTPVPDTDEQRKWVSSCAPELAAVLPGVTRSTP